MTIHLPALSGIILVYLLVFARTGAMIMLLPAIGDIGVPSRVRLLLAVGVELAEALDVIVRQPCGDLGIVAQIAQHVMSPPRPASSHLLRPEA